MEVSNHTIFKTTDATFRAPWACHLWKLPIGPSDLDLISPWKTEAAGAEAQLLHVLEPSHPKPQRHSEEFQQIDRWKPQQKTNSRSWEKPPKSICQDAGLGRCDLVGKLSNWGNGGTKVELMAGWVGGQPFCLWMSRWMHGVCSKSDWFFGQQKGKISSLILILKLFFFNKIWLHPSVVNIKTL